MSVSRYRKIWRRLVACLRRHFARQFVYDDYKTINLFSATPMKLLWSAQRSYHAFTHGEYELIDVEQPLDVI